MHPSPVDYLCSPPGDACDRAVVKAGCSQAVAEARDRETLDYQRWLQGASVKGMKPLFCCEETGDGRRSAFPQ